MPKMNSLLPDQTYSGPTMGPSTGYELLYDPGFGGRRDLPVVNPPPKTSQYMEPGLEASGVDPTTDFLPFGWMKKLAEMGIISAKSVLGLKGAAIGATAYHGSPHLFDKFRLDKIGTGEGATVKGWGIYQAENPEVAKFYLPKQAGELDYDISKGAWKVIKDQTSPGYLYKSDIPDKHVNNMLDLDNYLSDQTPQVKKILKRHGYMGDGEITGDELYKNLVEQEHYSMVMKGEIPGHTLPLDNMEAQKKVSLELRKIGIKGNKYLDQVSRETGGGTRNFVVFDENLPKILERK